MNNIKQVKVTKNFSFMLMKQIVLKQNAPFIFIASQSIIEYFRSHIIT